MGADDVVLVRQAPAQGELGKVVDELGAQVVHKGALAGLAEEGPPLAQNHHFEVAVDDVDAHSMRAALMPGVLVRLVELRDPCFTVQIAPANGLRGSLVGANGGLHRDRDAGHDHILAVAQHADALGEVCLQLEAADLKPRRPSAQCNALLGQRGAQPLPELVAEHPLRQVQLLLQRGQQIHYRRLTSCLQVSECFVQTHDVDREHASGTEEAFEHEVVSLSWSPQAARGQWPQNPW